MSEVVVGRLGAVMAMIIDADDNHDNDLMRIIDYWSNSNDDGSNE